MDDDSTDQNDTNFVSYLQISHLWLIRSNSWHTSWIVQWMMLNTKPVSEHKNYLWSILEYQRNNVTQEPNIRLYSISQSIFLCHCWTVDGPTKWILNIRWDMWFVRQKVWQSLEDHNPDWNKWFTHICSYVIHLFADFEQLSPMISMPTCVTQCHWSIYILLMTFVWTWSSIHFA